MNEKQKEYVRKYEKEKRANDPEWAEKRRAYQREYMRKFYARKKRDPEWLAKYREDHRLGHQKRKNDPEIIRKKREAFGRWYKKHGKEYHRAWWGNEENRKRQRKLAQIRRLTPGPVREAHLEKRRAYSKTPKVVARRKEWAKRYRKTPNGRRAFLRGDLKKNYSLTLEQYESMVVAQGGVCAICHQFKADAKHPRLSVDHCHKTGKIRGLLCTWCNSIIGHSKDNPSTLISASEYLRKFENGQVSS